MIAVTLICFVILFITYQCIHMPKKKQSSAGKKQRPVKQRTPFEFRWVDAFDLKRILNISRTTLYKWEILKLVVPAFIGGKKYYDLLAVEKHLEATQKKLRKKS